MSRQSWRRFLQTWREHSAANTRRTCPRGVATWSLTSRTNSARPSGVTGSAEKMSDACERPPNKVVSVTSFSLVKAVQRAWAAAPSRVCCDARKSARPLCSRFVQWKDRGTGLCREGGCLTVSSVERGDLICAHTPPVSTFHQSPGMRPQL